MAWDTGLAKRHQIYNIFPTNIRIHKEIIDKVNQQWHLQVLYALQDIRHLRIRCDAERLAPNGQSGTGRLTLSAYAPTAKPPVFSNSLRSIIQWRCRDFSLSPFHSESRKTRPFLAPPPHRGHNRLRFQSATRPLSPEYRNIT